MCEFECVCVCVCVCVFPTLDHLMLHDFDFVLVAMVTVKVLVCLLVVLVVAEGRRGGRRGRRRGGGGGPFGESSDESSDEPFDGFFDDFGGLDRLRDLFERLFDSDVPRCIDLRSEHWEPRPRPMEGMGQGELDMCLYLKARPHLVTDHCVLSKREKLRGMLSIWPIRSVFEESENFFAGADKLFICSICQTMLAVLK